VKRDEWLQQIRPNDVVAVYFGVSRMGDEVVTSAPRTFVTVGKYRRKVSFSRKDGCMAGKRPMARWFHIEPP
jgi:hypothetical protein